MLRLADLRASPTSAARIARLWRAHSGRALPSPRGADRAFAACVAHRRQSINSARRSNRQASSTPRAAITRPIAPGTAGRRDSRSAGRRRRCDGVIQASPVSSTIASGVEVMVLDDGRPHDLIDALQATSCEARRIGAHLVGVDHCGGHSIASTARQAGVELHDVASSSDSTPRGSSYVLRAALQRPEAEWAIVVRGGASPMPAALELLLAAGSADEDALAIGAVPLATTRFSQKPSRGGWVPRPSPCSQRPCRMSRWSGAILPPCSALQSGARLLSGSEACALNAFPHPMTPLRTWQSEAPAWAPRYWRPPAHSASEVPLLRSVEPRSASAREGVGGHRLSPLCLPEIRAILHRRPPTCSLRRPVSSATCLENGLSTGWLWSAGPVTGPLG